MFDAVKPSRIFQFYGGSNSEMHDFSINSSHRCISFTFMSIWIAYSKKTRNKPCFVHKCWVLMTEYSLVSRWNGFGEQFLIIYKNVDITSDCEIWIECSRTYCLPIWTDTSSLLIMLVYDALFSCHEMFSNDVRTVVLYMQTYNQIVSHKSQWPIGTIALYLNFTIFDHAHFNIHRSY